MRNTTAGKINKKNYLFSLNAIVEQDKETEKTQHAIWPIGKVWNATLLIDDEIKNNIEVVQGPGDKLIDNTN